MTGQTADGNESEFGIDWGRSRTWFRCGLLTAGISVFLVQGAGEAVALMFDAIGAEHILDNLFVGIVTVDLARLAAGIVFLMGVGCLFGYASGRTWSRKVDWGGSAAGGAEASNSSPPGSSCCCCSMHP